MDCAEAYFFLLLCAQQSFSRAFRFRILTTLITESVFFVMRLHVMQMAISLDFFTFQSDEWR